MTRGMAPRVRPRRAAIDGDGPQGGRAMTRNARLGWLLGLATVALAVAQELRTPATQRR